MSSIAIDTHAYVKELTDAGFTAKQAESQVKVLVTALKQIEQARLNGMASKRDVKEIELKIVEVKKDLEIKIAEVKKEIIEVKKGLELQITEVKRDLEVQIAEVKKEIANSKTETIKWVAGMLIVQSGLIIGGFFAIIQYLLK